jgi:hypothetical protein
VIGSTSEEAPDVAHPAPAALDRGVVSFLGQASLAGPGGGPCRPALPRGHQAAGEQRSHLLPRVFKVTVLVAGALAGYDQQAPGVEPPRGERPQPLPRGLGEADHPGEVYAQLDLGGDFVHVLAAGSGRAHRAHLQRRGGHGQTGDDRDRLGHPWTLARPARLVKTPGQAYVAGEHV